MENESNRRQAHRTPVEGEHAFGEIVIEGGRIPVLIADESVGGIGVVAVNVQTELEPGMEILFESKVRHATGRVGSLKYVHLAGADIYRIGLEWTD